MWSMSYPDADSFTISLCAKAYSSLPPAHLVTMVRSLLLSTLLQPSAVFLSLWYIVKLPVFFGNVMFGPELAKEMQFRVELDRLLLNHAPTTDKGNNELQTAYRVTLLGFMFANKWLDDHTFSNKTW
jgi:hypothetical protein